MTLAEWAAFFYYLAVIVQGVFWTVAVSLIAAALVRAAAVSIALAYIRRT
jgi:hypothetical protein